MGIPDHLICLLRNLYACQEVTVRTERGTTDLFQIGKGVRQSCVLAPCLFNFYAEFSSVAQSCLTLCDSMDCSKPGFLVYHQLPKFTQTHVHWEKAVVTHSSTLAWKIAWTEEPGRQQSRGSPRVGHDWVTSLSLFTFIHWRRKWQPTPVFLPGESQGRPSLVGCHLWGHTQSDTTEAT